MSCLYKESYELVKCRNWKCSRLVFAWTVTNVLRYIVFYVHM